MLYCIVPFLRVLPRYMQHAINASYNQRQRFLLFKSLTVRKLRAPNAGGALEAEWVSLTDISQYRLRFGSSLLYKSVFHLNSLTAQLSYEGRAEDEGGGQVVFLNFTTII
jgi:hypothetical protein